MKKETSSRQLWRIEGAGAVSAVGTRCWQSAASWVAGTRRFRRQVIEAVGLHPLTVATCPEVTQGTSGATRLARLLAVALADLMIQQPELIRREKVPALVMLALPATLDARAADEVWTQTLEQLVKFGYGGILEDVHCYLFLHGTIAGMRALGALFAKQLPEGSVAVLAGVDSLAELSRLRSDYESDHLMTRANKEGWIAGEASAALLLQSVPSTQSTQNRQWVFHSPASVEGAEVHKGVAPKPPAAASALALNRALENAGWRAGNVGVVMSDHDGSRWRALIHAQARAQVPDFLAAPEWLPTSVTGQVGAATAPLHWSLAAARLQFDKTSPNSILSTVLDTGPWTGAVAMERTLGN